MIYYIPEWDKHFETAKSRTFKRCANVCMPNKQDGLGFTRIMSLPDGAAIFGIWCLILQACSRQAAPRQGYLTDTGVSSGCPWTIQDLAMRWRRPEAEITRAIEVLTSQGIGWLSVYDATDTARIPHGYHTDTSVPLDLNRLDLKGLVRTPSETTTGGIVEVNPDDPIGTPAKITPPPPIRVKVAFTDWVAYGHPRVSMRPDDRPLWEALWRVYEPADNRIEIWDEMYAEVVKTITNDRFKIWPSSAQEWLNKFYPPQENQP